MSPIALSDFLLIVISEEPTRSNASLTRRQTVRPLGPPCGQRLAMEADSFFPRLIRRTLRADFTECASINFSKGGTHGNYKCSCYYKVRAVTKRCRAGGENSPT